MLEFFFKNPGRVHFWYAFDTNLFRLGPSIQKHAGSPSAPRLGAEGAKPPVKIWWGHSYEIHQFLMIYSLCSGFRFLSPFLSTGLRGSLVDVSESSLHFFQIFYSFFHFSVDNLKILLWFYTQMNISPRNNWTNYLNFLYT